MTRPNLILLTVGSSNSTVVIRMLGKLGWNLGQVDGVYSEHVEAHRINRRVHGGRGFAEASAEKMLADLAPPWAIKDPLFAHTLRLWRPFLEPYRPALLWITKDLSYVRQSFRRRFNMPESLATRRHQWCEAYFAGWPWGKLQIDADEISRAVELYDPARSSRFLPIS